MGHSKVIDEIVSELMDKLFPNTRANQYYGKVVEVDEEILNKFNSTPLVNPISSEDLRKILRSNNG